MPGCSGHVIICALWLFAGARARRDGARCWAWGGAACLWNDICGGADDTVLENARLL